MIFKAPLKLFARSSHDQWVGSAFAACVDLARAPELYTAYAVPDTREGRFEMLVAQVYLAIRTLRADAVTGQDKAQALFDRLIEELEGTLREDGFQDKGFKKRIKHLVATVYERFGRYEAALKAQDRTALSRELAEVVWEDAAVTPRSDALSAHLFETALSGQQPAIA